MNLFAGIASALLALSFGGAPARSDGTPSGTAAGAVIAPSSPDRSQAPRAGGTLAESLSRLDALYAHRDDPATFVEAHRLAAAAVAEGSSSYDALWRAARETCAEIDQPNRSEDERARLGKEAFDLAERARAINPRGVEGHYWAVLGIGRYAETMGVIRALAHGIEGKFTRPLERATALDVRYDHGNIPVIWAAYHMELPWPKRDRAKAAQELQQALTINPANLRARLYQARLAVDEGREADARKLLEGIASAPVGRYDAPEERAVKKEAALLAAGLSRPH